MEYTDYVFVVGPKYLKKYILLKIKVCYKNV